MVMEGTAPDSSSSSFSCLCWAEWEHNTTINSSGAQQPKCVPPHHRALLEQVSSTDNGELTGPSPICRQQRREDPFLPENKIPLPVLRADVTRTSLCSDGSMLICDEDGLVTLAMDESGVVGGGVRRRNERERQRVRSVNEGFEKLRSALPRDRYLELSRQKRLSKVDVLKAAIEYIRLLQQQVKS